jgi:hypothetical protein
VTVIFSAAPETSGSKTGSKKKRSGIFIWTGQAGFFGDANRLGKVRRTDDATQTKTFSKHAAPRGDEACRFARVW